jgi:hypothetical protein
MKKTCCYCSDPFHADPRRFRSLGAGKGRRSHQTACTKPLCQQQRRKETQRRWRIKNPTYDDGRELYLSQWRKKHPGYSTAYRKSHPNYEKWNCRQQHRRDQKKRNLGKQDVIERVQYEKLTRIQCLIDLGKQDVIKISPMRVSEEMRRYLSWSHRLGKQDVIALQKKIAQNRGHEKTNP